MTKRDLVRCLSLVAGLLGGAAAVFGADLELATDTPAATIATLQRGLVAVAQRQPPPPIDERFAALEPLIVATHDLPYIVEFALRRQWAALGADDRERFVAAFQRLSVMTYAARFRAVGAETFRPIVAAEAGSGRAEVSTAIVRDGAADVSLDYLLQRGPEQGADGWRIINVVADGVSDLALKRAEYQRLLAAGNIDSLIAELEAQTERLRGD